MMNHDQRTSTSRCSHELWEGVSCTLQAGHAGPHHSPASVGGCSLSWRSSAPALRHVPRASPPQGVPHLGRLPAWAFASPQGD